MLFFCIARPNFDQMRREASGEATQEEGSLMHWRVSLDCLMSHVGRRIMILRKLKVFSAFVFLWTGSTQLQANPEPVSAKVSYASFLKDSSTGSAYDLTKLFATPPISLS